MNDIEYKNDETYIKGKKVKTNWKFISDGTWYDKGEECKLETDCGWMGGLFRGIRTSKGEKYELVVEGIKYEDGEICKWEEFDIYDENDILLLKATCNGDDTNLIGIH